MSHESSSSGQGRTVLVEGGHVVTMDPDRRVLADGSVLIRDGRIDAVEHGPVAADADVRIDARGCVVVPGFVNTHQHPWYNLFKDLGAGMLLEQWIENLLRPTAQALAPADLEASMRLACLEMLGSGTTTCLNHSVTMTGRDEVEATLHPVLESGMRQVFAKEVRPASLDDQLALAAELHRDWHGAGGGRIAMALVLESTAHWVAMGTSSEELLLRGNELADRLAMRVSDHVAGGTMSREQGYLRFVREMGRTDIEFLQKLGVLDRKWILAHAVHVRDRDIELIAESGAGVSHTPTSESARGGGITPIRRLRDAGVLVGLGSDGPMVDTSVDMVEQMKATVLFQNQLHLDPLGVTAEQALAMATIDAARLAGVGDRVGSLEVGKRGDVAVYDLQTPATAVWHDPVGALVHSLVGARPRHVLVDGDALVRDGAFTRVGDDEVRDIIGEARSRSRALLDRVEVPAHRSRNRSELPAIV